MSCFNLSLFGQPFHLAREVVERTRLLTKSCEVILLICSSYFSLLCRTSAGSDVESRFRDNEFIQRQSLQERPTEEDNDQLDLPLFVFSLLTSASGDW